MDAEGAMRSSSPMNEDAMPLVFSMDDFQGPFEPIPKASKEAQVSPPPDPLRVSMNLNILLLNVKGFNGRHAIGNL